MILREEWLQKKPENTLPPALKTVRADIIKHVCTVRQRQVIAGTEQFRQEGHAAIPISEWTCRFIEEFKIPGATVKTAISFAVAKCGYRRPTEEVSYLFILDARLLKFLFQATLYRTYGPLANFIANTGETVLKGIRALENRKEKVTFYSFRALEGLITPAARNELLYVFNNPDITLNMLENAIRAARHRQWCKFVWDRHPQLSEDHSMHH